MRCFDKEQVLFCNTSFIIAVKFTRQGAGKHKKSEFRLQSTHSFSVENNLSTQLTVMEYKTHLTMKVQGHMSGFQGLKRTESRAWNNLASVVFLVKSKNLDQIFPSCISNHSPAIHFEFFLFCL